jgi:hypothetical protein
MISIAPWSLTMTDPQPSKPILTQPNQRLNQEPIPGSTNHVRVHAAHDHEHDCYTHFTLCRGCTRSPWVMIIIGKPNNHCTDVLGNHYKVVQWFHLACNVPTEVSPPVWASHPHRSPLLCLMGSSHLSYTHTIPWFSHCSFTEYPSGSTITASPHNRLVRQD